MVAQLYSGTIMIKSYRVRIQLAVWYYGMEQDTLSSVLTTDSLEIYKLRPESHLKVT